MLGLEDTMNSQVQDTGTLLERALKLGDSCAPQKLLSAIENISRPLDLLLSDEPEAGPYEAFQDEFRGLCDWRFDEQPLPQADEKSAVELLRWVLDEFAVWSPKTDPRQSKLTGLMIVLNTFRFDEGHWAQLLDSSISSDFTGQLLRILKSCSFGFQHEGTARTKDFLASIESADLDRDWTSISDNCQAIKSWICGNSFLDVAIPCLYRFSLGDLVAELDWGSSFLKAYLISIALAKNARLELARASTSDRYRFAVMLSLQWQGPFEGLDKETTQKLSELLVEISQNDDQWMHWMHSFNRYPVRFPAAQKALGMALSQASMRALEIYLHSIELHAITLPEAFSSRPDRPDSRQAVALCLQEFNATASREQRRSLWQLAYDHWKSWNFGITPSSDSILLYCAGCEIDYAITAYAQEPMSSSDR
jgi:hypothetical protein